MLRARYELSDDEPMEREEAFTKRRDPVRKELPKVRDNLPEL